MGTSVVEFTATGRRKEAVARVRLANGVGKVIVNGQDFEDYFPDADLRDLADAPLKITDTHKQYDVIVNVRGGGKSGQAGAIQHGIARALVNADANLKEVVKDNGFLTRDARMKERKKYGQPGARKRFQFSKR